jgi:hypothetical protein
MTDPFFGYTVNQMYDEESPVTCGYPYGISKPQGERGVLQLQDRDFSVIALRKGTVCGFSPRMRLDLLSRRANGLPSLAQQVCYGTRRQ